VTGVQTCALPICGGQFNMIRRHKNMPIRPFLTATLFLLVSTSACAEAMDISHLSWLSGCWNSEASEPGSGEQWLPLAGGTLLGVSRTVKQGKTVAFEFMQIRALENE